jgi:sodium/bile acid cotransporter 7
LHRFLRQQWFLIVLVLAYVLGTWARGPLAPLANTSWGVAIQWLDLAAIMFFMSLPLESRAMARAMKNPVPPLIAIAISFGILPVCAWFCSKLLVEDMARGLLVTASIPCTLASAAVWTRKAGGNDAVAILVTVVTNSLCFLVTPLWLSVFLATPSDAKDELWGEILKLLFFVVLPIVLGQVCRLHVGFANWATLHKGVLSIVTQCGILYTVFIGAIKTGETLIAAAASNSLIVQTAVMVIVVLGLHLTMLGLGLLLSWLIRLDRADGIAVAFASSQKTLAVGIQLATRHHASLLPMITYHAGQLILDTLIADRMRAARSKPTPPI